MLLKPLTDGAHLQQELRPAELRSEDAAVTINLFICHGNPTGIDRSPIIHDRVTAVT